MSQRCTPRGPGCYYRCPICGQWWRYDPPTEFWDPINTLGMFFSHHSVSVSYTHLRAHETDT